jgi:hypothetical protein
MIIMTTDNDPDFLHRTQKLERAQDVTLVEDMANEDQPPF